jgi:cob(I)alamin adenosyltransferase
VAFYTGNGDDGYTGVLGAGRVPKEDLRIEALGTLDEVTAALGFARSVAYTSETALVILRIQRDLYLLMAEVAATPENAAQFRQIGEEHVAWLESQIDAIGRQVEMPKEFIVPGDTLPGAALSLARAIVRRAERRVAALLHQRNLENIEILRYLNRLSSLCFVLELRENQAGGKEKPTLAKKT